MVGRNSSRSRIAGHENWAALDISPHIIDDDDSPTLNTPGSALPELTLLATLLSLITIVSNCHPPRHSGPSNDVKSFTSLNFCGIDRRHHQMPFKNLWVIDPELLLLLFLSRVVHHLF